jgi:hypothetical protein
MLVIGFLVLWGRRQKREEPALSAAHQHASITELSLGAYIRSSPLIKEVDEAIGHDLGYTLARDSIATYIHEQEARAHGIKTIGELDNLLRQHRRETVLMAHYVPFNGPTMGRGDCLMFLFSVLGAKLGVDRYSELLSGIKNVTASRRWAENVVQAYENISSAKG